MVQLNKPGQQPHPNPLSNGWLEQRDSLGGQHAGASDRRHVATQADGNAKRLAAQTCGWLIRWNGRIFLSGRGWRSNAIAGLTPKLRMEPYA
jgi:hypothetical protein